MDLSTGESWTLRPNLGPVPWWMLVPSRRVPGTGWRDYLGLLKLLRTPPGATVAECLDTRSALYKRLWEPLAVAALNIDPALGSARLMGAVVAETFTPARRAFERPIAIACFADLAPCLPSRMWCISSRMNSPACVVGALPWRRAFRARSTVFFSGM